MNDLSRVVIVTGAGSGLGEATAVAFAREGCNVACLDINVDELDRVGRAVEKYDVQCVATRCNISKQDEVAEAVAEVVNQFGTVDVLVNCAAIDHTVSVDDMTIEQWDQVIGVNLRGPFMLAKAVLPTMRQKQNGHIVNVASTAATGAWANASAYHASKWGLVGFGRGLGVEGRPDGIRVTTVIPGGMRTHFFDRFIDQGIPMPEDENLQDPAVVADAIVYATNMPRESVMQELMITPLTETSWP